MGKKVNGEVEDIREWQSGKGYFFTVKNQQYAAFGTCKIEEGDRVTVEQGKDFGKDGDTLQGKIVQREKISEEEWDEPTEGETEASAAPAEKFDKNAEIRRMSALKCAASLVTGLPQGCVHTMKEIIADAQLAEVYIRTGKTNDTTEKMVQKEKADEKKKEVEAFL